MGALLVAKGGVKDKDVKKVGTDGLPPAASRQWPRATGRSPNDCFVLSFR
ncbi:hypothetical protein LJR234_003735 [Mesorhizobium amorphae]